MTKYRIPLRNPFVYIQPIPLSMANINISIQEQVAYPKESITERLIDYIEDVMPLYMFDMRRALGIGLQHLQDRLD